MEKTNKTKLIREISDHIFNFKCAIGVLILQSQYLKEHELEQKLENSVLVNQYRRINDIFMVEVAQ